MSKYIPISETLAHAKATYEVGEPPTAAVGGPPLAALEAIVVWRPKGLTHAKTTYKFGEPPPATINEPPPTTLGAVVVWRPSKNNMSKPISERPAHAKTTYEVGEPPPAAVDEPAPAALEAAVEWKPNRNNMSGYVPISEGLLHAKTTYEAGEPPPATINEPPPTAFGAVVVWRPSRSGMSKYIPISNSTTLQSNQKEAIRTQIDSVMTSQNQTNNGESNQLSNNSLKLPACAKGQLLQNILLRSTQLSSEFRKQQNSASNNKSSHPNKVKIFGNKQNTQHLTNTWPNSYASFSSLHYNLKNPPLIWNTERLTHTKTIYKAALEAAVVWMPNKKYRSKHIPISETLAHAKATYEVGEPPTAAVGGPPPAALEAVVEWNKNNRAEYIPFVTLSKELNFGWHKIYFWIEPSH